MASFKEIRDFLVMCYAKDIFDDEEFLLLHDFYSSRKSRFPVRFMPPFDLHAMGDSECPVVKFRVHKRDISVLADALQIPATYHCRQRSVCEGLCMLLRRLSCPCRYGGDTIARFAQLVPVLSLLSMITNTVLDYIYDMHGHRITQWNDAVIMSATQLQKTYDNNFVLIWHS